VNGNVAARSGEWAQHFSNASCLLKAACVRATLTLIVNDELSVRRRRPLIRRRHAAGDELQLDGARVGHEDDLLTMLPAARRHAASTGAVANHRHVVAGPRRRRPGAGRLASRRRRRVPDERQQRHVDALSGGRAHLPRARRRPDAGAGRHRARHVR